MNARRGATLILAVAGALHLWLARITPAGTEAVAIGIFGVLYLGIAVALVFVPGVGIRLGRTIPIIGALAALGGIVVGDQAPFPWIVPLIALDIIVLWLCWSGVTITPTLPHKG